MADTKKTDGKENTSSFSKGLSAEWKKIKWPTKDTLTKQTIAVIVISVVLGLAITLLDSALQLGINFILK